MIHQDVAGALVTVVGAWLLYRSRKRIFDRKNAYGQEVFNSYARKLFARTVDLSLCFIAMAVMLTGVIFLAIEHQDTWGWIVLLPVAWLFVVGYIPISGHSVRSRQ